MKWMIAMAYGVLHNQMLMHQAYAIEFGLTAEELEAGVKLPTTLRLHRPPAENRRHGRLRRTGGRHAPLRLGLFRDRPTSCQRSSWSRLGLWPLDRLVQRAVGGQPCSKRPRAARSAGGISGRALALAEDSFAVSSRYEWMFWEMCWRGETWPV